MAKTSDPDQSKAANESRGDSRPSKGPQEGGSELIRSSMKRIMIRKAVDMEMISIIGIRGSNLS